MIRLGEFKFDPATGLLTDARGQLVPLRRKSIQTLAVLAASPGTLIDKDTLLTSVWKNVTVTDESLSQCIRDIRKALGDDTRQILRTIPGQGFLLAAEPSSQSSDATRVPVVGVRAIKNHSGDKEAQDLAERVRQEITRAISRRAGVRISSDPSASEIFDYEIRGAISRHGNTLDVFMEIDETGGRGTFFAENFELLDQSREEFVERLARKVTNVQRVSAIAHHGRQLLSEPDEALDLQQLLQKAAYFYSRITVEDTHAAQRVLSVATDRFPESPMALAMLAATYVHMFPLIKIDRSAERGKEAMEIAEKAVFAGPDVDFALRTRGNLKFWLLQDIEGALADCNRALAITPNYQLAHLTRVQIDLFSGNVAAAKERFDRHIEVDVALPQFHYFQTLLSLFALHEGDLTKAQHHAREAFDFAPWSDWGVLVLACAFAEELDKLPIAMRDRISASTLTPEHFMSLPSGDKGFPVSLAKKASKIGGWSFC